MNELQDLANIYLSLHRWDKVELLAEEMRRKALIQYHNPFGRNRREDARKNPARPLCFYILYSYLLQSALCDERGDYEQAIHYASLYAAPDWIRVQTPEEQKIVEQFREWSVANILLYRLMSGQTHVLAEYVEFIKAQDNEILPGLLKILQAANRFHFNVDEILDTFHTELIFKEQRSRLGKLNTQVTTDKSTTLLFEMAVYYLNHAKYETGITYILQTLEASVKINSESAVIKCVGLFEQFRHLSSREDQHRYKILISEVQSSYEKKISSVADGVRYSAGYGRSCVCR